tara:strand:- start:3468 stop:3647 length:180 start_codon:yes stop_codon:yes gene_type:complete
MNKFIETYYYGVLENGQYVDIGGTGLKEGDSIQTPYGMMKIVSREKETIDTRPTEPAYC